MSALSCALDCQSACKLDFQYSRLGFLEKDATCSGQFHAPLSSNEKFNAEIRFQATDELAER